MNAMSNDIQASSVRRFFHSNSHTFMSTIWLWIQLLTGPNLCDLICEVSNQGEKNWTVIELICLHTTKCTHLVVSHFSLSVLLLEKSFVILGCLWFLGSHKMLVLGIHIPQRDGNPWGLHKKRRWKPHETEVVNLQGFYFIPKSSKHITDSCLAWCQLTIFFHILELNNSKIVNLLTLNLKWKFQKKTSILFHKKHV
jgi:hypothetical protein